MLKLKRFEHSQTEAFDDFRKDHAPRNTDKSGGILINESGLYVFYEEGEPYDAVEQKAWLLEQIRAKKFEILQAEPQLRLHKKKIEDLKKDVVDRLESIDELTEELEKVPVVKGKQKPPRIGEIREELSSLKNQVESLEKRMKMDEEFVFVTESNRQVSLDTIASYRSVLADIESGEFKV